MADEETPAVEITAEHTDAPTTELAAEPEPAVEPVKEEEPAVEAPAPENWRDAIEDADLRKFADRIQSPTDAAKQLFEARKKLSTAVVVPGKNATDEDIAAFRTGLGIPETADGYKVELADEVLGGEEGAERFKSFTEAMHKLHVTQAQLQGIMDWYVPETEAVREATAKAEENALNKSAEETKATLRREWGTDAERNIGIAKTGAMEVGGQEFLDFSDSVIVDGMRLGDHPIWLRAMANVGHKLIEGEPLVGMSDDQVLDLRSEQSTLLAEQAQALDAGNSVEAERLDRRLQEIARKIGGESPIVGSRGVAA
jgi:hypothetical protein